MKHYLLTPLLLFSLITFSQSVISISGKGKLIADFSSVGEFPNVKGEYLNTHQTLVSIIEGTNIVKCMVRIEGTVNVIGQWELNDLNEVLVKVYEVEMEPGFTDILMVGVTDEKAVQINLFRKSGEDLNDLGYNYIEQIYAGKPMSITINDNYLVLSYDNGSENPKYGLVGNEFRELD
jgi:hypothetical protein